MSPKSHNWQKHICGLSRAIAMRGRNHKYSDANVKLIVGSRLLIILQALSSRQPVCFLTHKQQHKSPVSPAGLDVAAGVVDPCQDSAFPIDKNFYSLVDSITNIVTDLVVTMAEYDQLLIRSPSTIPEADVDFGKTLKVLYERAQTTLSRLDAVIGTVDPLMSEVPLNSYLSAHKVITGDPVLDDQFWTIAGRDIQTLFDKILSFPSMADCHTATLFWTAAMSLHIFIIDMLTVASSLNLNLTGANDLSEQIKKHRFRLMVYIRQVLQSIIFFELEENRKLSPFFLAVAFQMSEVVLERESEALRSEGAKDAEINECGKLQELTSRYITWATQTKIAIKMDINIPQRRTARPSKMV
ncbi:hypothetical protein BX600DRAFT_165220 [Xylariales sp. PMI_506]|nr:hypothetical protein BX600DRAFT_165220 [Xylariales sp. PMI_506]